MTTVHQTFRLNLGSLPVHSDEADIRLDMRDYNGVPTMTISPRSGTALRMACGLVLAGAGGAETSGTGQLLVTDHRVIGLFTGGRSGTQDLDDASGSVSFFSLDRANAVMNIKRNWRGKPVGLEFRAGKHADKPFLLDVFSVVAVLFDDDTLDRWDLSDLLDYLEHEASPAT